MEQEYIYAIVCNVNEGTLIVTTYGEIVNGIQLVDLFYVNTLEEARDLFKIAAEQIHNQPKDIVGDTWKPLLDFIDLTPVIVKLPTKNYHTILEQWETGDVFSFKTRYEYFGKPIHCHKLKRGFLKRYAVLDIYKEIMGKYP